MTISVEQLYANNLIDVKLKYIFINSPVTDCYLVYCFLVMSKIYTVISHNKSRLIFFIDNKTDNKTLSIPTSLSNL